MQSCHKTVGSIVDMTAIHSLQMQQNNILTTGFPEGYFVKEISFQDMNHDNYEKTLSINGISDM